MDSRRNSCRLAAMARARRPSRPSLPQSASASDATVCRAGYFQFSAGQAFTNGCVQSRALFWCKSGNGEFVVDGTRHELSPHDLYVLPWNRRISYLPSPRQPMFTAHVHLVPWYRPGARWVPNVPHERTEPEFDSPDRSDADLGFGTGVIRLRTEADEPLGRLIDYTVRWFLQSRREEVEGRALGLLLVREVLRATTRGSGFARDLPEELRRLLVHVERGFHLAPTVESMAAILGRSRSHVLKLFRRNLGVTAKGHVIARQLQEARELLLSTTLTIAEVGQAAGLPDPYHFSKLFRRHVGISPREYRAKHGPFSKVLKPSRHKRVPPAPEGATTEGVY